jgi:hypothetical protein
MARPKTTPDSKLRNTITTFLSKLPEAERAELLEALASSVIDDSEAMLTEAQEKEAQRAERAEAKAAREAQMPSELREAKPLAALRKAVKTVKPGDLGPEDLQGLRELLTQLLALLSDAPRSKGTEEPDTLAPSSGIAA